MKNIISRLHFFVSILTLAAIIAEFFFAGLGVFGATTFSLHKETGEAITCATFLLLLLSFLGLIGKKRMIFSALLVALMILQNLLVHVPDSYIAALHPLNGLAIMGVTAMLVRSGTVKAATQAKPITSR